MRLSIVTTLYHSAPYIEEFYQRATASAQVITQDYEIVFVNDGSPDDSLEIAIALYERDKRVKIIDLSRNFGHHRAIMTGLTHAHGDLVFLIDSDLEEPPEILKTFYEVIKDSRTDVVYGVQRKRKGNSFEQLSGEIYYVLFKLLSGYKADSNVLTARLMTRDYVRALVEHKEREFDIMGLWSLTGFKQSSVAVDKLSKGTTVYSLRRKISLSINTVTAFSSRPLLAIFLLGVIILSLSGVSVFYLMLKYLFIGAVEGWLVVAISLWLLGGLIITCLGIIGIYTAKIFIETKQRPYTIVRKFYGDETVQGNE
ncbi:MAG: glycosyltransferase family 2 protein [Acidobacteriota bacterium]|nr:glycosyltransferase family 2 protein [Acidobacteriota bacterium]